MSRRRDTIGVFFILALLAGCGGSAGPPPAPTPKPRRATPTVTVTPAELPTSAPTFVQDTETPLPSSTPTTPATAVPTRSATPRPIPTRRVVIQPPSVLSASLRPATVVSGGTLDVTVAVSGAASQVVVYLSSGPGGGAPVTYTLAKGSGDTWFGTGSAPTTGGDYHYSIGLFDSAGKRTVADNDNWNITVTAAQSQSGPEPLPADVPLAPPFSYGNPVSAIFNAAGKTVNGSEVTSDSRPDVSPSVVAQFYETHLPRAGWTVDPSTFPAAGAAAFTIVATNGNRACVVQYSNASVSIFYGSF